MPRIADVIRAGLAAGRSDESILADVRATFPAARTNANCVRWYRWQANGGRPGTRTERDETTSTFDAADVLTDRAFGIEFEFLTTSRDGSVRGIEAWGRVLRPVLGDRLHVRDSYSHSDGRNWELKLDGSCGLELVTPRITRRDWPLVVAVLEALNAAGARVSRACGLHVHHETRDYAGRAIVNLHDAWATFGAVIGRLLPASRRANSYCMPLHPSRVGRTERQIRGDNDGGSRYVALNLQHFWASGRVEVRQHQGTLNAAKTLAWVALTQAMVEAAKSSSKFTPARTRAVTVRSFERQFESLNTWSGVRASVADVFRRRLDATVDGTRRVA